jgi:hypothetical protein
MPSRRGGVSHSPREEPHFPAGVVSRPSTVRRPFARTSGLAFVLIKFARLHTGLHRQRQRLCEATDA